MILHSYPFHYRIMAELESFFNSWQSLNRCSFYSSRKPAGLPIYREGFGIFVLLLLLLVGTSFNCHLLCCRLAPPYVMFVCLAKTFVTCFLARVCVCSSNSNSSLLQARQTRSTIDASRSFLPRRLPIFNVHTFRQPVLSFVAAPPALLPS